MVHERIAGRKTLGSSGKTEMIGGRSLVTVPLVLLLGACAFARAGEDRFSYTPSVSVKEEDYGHCDARARAAAHRAVAEVSDEAETFAALTGGLGAWLSLEYGSSVEQSAYKETFEDCLQEKGYTTDG